MGWCTGTAPGVRCRWRDGWSPRHVTSPQTARACGARNGIRKAQSPATAKVSQSPIKRNERGGVPKSVSVSLRLSVTQSYSQSRIRMLGSSGKSFAHKSATHKHLRSQKLRRTGKSCSCPQRPGYGSIRYGCLACVHFPMSRANMNVCVRCTVVPYTACPRTARARPHSALRLPRGTALESTDCPCAIATTTPTYGRTARPLACCNS